MVSSRVVSGSKTSSASRTSSTSSTTSTSSTSSRPASMRSAGQLSTSQMLAQHAEAMGPLSAPPHSAIFFEPSRAMTPYITVGPVIGLVTDTTARVLIEASASCEVCCYLTDATGTQHGSRRDVKRNRPFVFSFENLKPRTYYRVTLDIPVPGLVKSGFSTLPRGWKLGRHGARLAFVAHNSFTSSRQDIAHNRDMWRELYKHLNHGEIDYVLHLGDNVYADSDRYHPKTDVYMGKQGGMDCPRLEALALLENTPCGEWANMRSDTLDVFRAAYRTTWNHPTTKHCLANTPNLFMLGQQEIAHNLMSVGLSPETQALEHFVACCAYEAYNEYCRSLHEEYYAPLRPLETPNACGQAYHFHALGDVGFMFVDSRAFAGGIHREGEASGRFPMLGEGQWADIDYALRDKRGYFSRCRLLVVCSATPVALCGEQGYLKAATGGVPAKTALTTTWNSPEHMPEASLLMTRLFDWRAQAPARREVVMAGGGAICGGMTDIADLRYLANPKLKVIKQIVTGPIAASLSSQPKVSHGLKKTMMSNNGLGVNHQFQHYNVVKTNNFAVLDATCATDGQVRFLAQHYMGTKAGFSTSRAVSSTFCRWGFSGKPVSPTARQVEDEAHAEHSETSTSSFTSMSTSSAKRHGISHSMSSSEVAALAH